MCQISVYRVARFSIALASRRCLVFCLDFCIQTWIVVAYYFHCNKIRFPEVFYFKKLFWIAFCLLVLFRPNVFLWKNNWDKGKKCNDDSDKERRSFKGYKFRRRTLWITAPPWGSIHVQSSVEFWRARARLSFAIRFFAFVCFCVWRNENIGPDWGQIALLLICFCSDSASALMVFAFEVRNGRNSNFATVNWA